MKCWECTKEAGAKLTTCPEGTDCHKRALKSELTMNEASFLVSPSTYNVYLRMLHILDGHIKAKEAKCINPKT
jgi:hypothetical protein